MLRRAVYDSRVVVAVCTGHAAIYVFNADCRSGRANNITKSCPTEAPGRVFGLAQAVESASSPISAFLIGPIAQFGLIPFMNSQAGKDMFGWLLGTGQARGIALVFLCASIIMLIIVLWAFTTKSYRRLADYYQTAPSPKVAN